MMSFSENSFVGSKSSPSPSSGAAPTVLEGVQDGPSTPPRADIRSPNENSLLQSPLNYYDTNAVHFHNQPQAGSSRKRLRAFLSSVDREVGLILRRGGPVSASAKNPGSKKRQVEKQKSSFIPAQPLRSRFRSSSDHGLAAPATSVGAMTREVSQIGMDAESNIKVSTTRDDGASKKTSTAGDEELVSGEVRHVSTALRCIFCCIIM
jgi:hypothetical protein